MSVPHHGSSGETDPIKRYVDLIEGAEDYTAQGDLNTLFAEQQRGSAKAEYARGHLTMDDGGRLAYHVSTYLATRTIKIEFPKPVTWLGMDATAAEELRDRLTEALHALRGITS